MSQDSAIRHMGYIGMGIMGSAMAANLLKGGFQITVWNRTKSRCDTLKQAGAAVADSPADLAAKGMDVICTNVTDTPDVEAVLFGPNGVASKAKPGLIVVDHSTISPVKTKEFADRLAKQQIIFLDAPVSGGDVGARNGTLSIMVGGDEKAFQRCLPMFQAMGKTITHLGPAGMGQTCKACNQICVSVNLLGLCEALALAKKSGLDLTKMLDAIKGGAAGSWQLTNIGAKIATGDHAPGFMIDLVLKDLALVDDAARNVKLPLNATVLAEAYFRSAQAHGAGRLGTQAIAKTVEMLGDFRYDK